MNIGNGGITPEAALGAAFASILMNSIVLNAMVLRGVIPPASIVELMDEALLQVEQVRGLNSATAVVADFARAHLENIYGDLNTLPPAMR
jgi:hypothetical protein